MALGVTLEASASWDADEVWNSPLIFSLSKVTVLGKRPVNLSVGAGPNIASPSGGADWRLRLAAVFLFAR